MNTYNWKILSVYNYPTVIDPVSGNTFYDVIYAVQWQIYGTDLTTNNTAWIYDMMAFNIELNSNYIPRNQMTDEILIGWVQDNLGTEKIAELEDQIDSLISNA
jgi:hypothetical protein